jgi:hypothetical protein
LNVVLTPLVAEGLCELTHRSFGGSIGRNGQSTLECKEGAKVDDFTPTKGYHVASCGLGQKPYRFEIHVEDLTRPDDDVIGVMGDGNKEKLGR